MCHNPGMVRPRPAIAALAAALCVIAAVAPLGAALRPPKLNYQVARLPNGLTVVLLEDHSTPIVHAQVWYHVGSKDERAGRTGFAHLFEHLMFKGSKNVRADSHASMISSVGGMANAYTTEDVTVFWETVPAQDLPLVLWLEADRMASLRVDKDTFERERAVVKEERRLRVENQPYGNLAEVIYGTRSPSTPTGTPSPGACRTSTPRRWTTCATSTGPTTCPATPRWRWWAISTPSRRSRSSTQYFGPVPPSDARDSPRPAEGARADSRRTPPVADRELAAAGRGRGLPRDLRRASRSYPLHIASKVLSDGQSSRIYRALVYEKRLALAAFGGGNIVEEPNLFYAVAMVQAGRTPAEVADALIAELDRLRGEPVTAARAGAREEPVRARLRRRARVEPAEGAAARARHRDSQGRRRRRPTVSSTSS